MAGRKKGQGSKWINPVTRKRLYKRDDYTCVYCGDSVEDGARLSLDHVIPCELGGENAHDNLVTACFSCNSAKRDLTMRAWFVVLRDRGVDTDLVGTRVRNARRRQLPR